MFIYLTFFVFKFSYHFGNPQTRKAWDLLASPTTLRYRQTPLQNRTRNNHPTLVLSSIQRIAPLLRSKTKVSISSVLCNETGDFQSGTYKCLLANRDCSLDSAAKIDNFQTNAHRLMFFVSNSWFRHFNFSMSMTPKTRSTGMSQYQLRTMLTLFVFNFRFHNSICFAAQK